MSTIKIIFFSLIVICSNYDNVQCQCNNLNPCRHLRGGNDLTHPTVLRSVNGELKVVLMVEMASFTFDWFTTQRRSYNGSIPGPTWRIKPGDNVTVTLINALEESFEIKPKPPNTKRFPNITNLHTHGLHISSKEPQDNVFVVIEPGNNYTYRYQIVEDHPAGTYWYHPHLHGSVTFQILSGMAGIIIIEDPATGPAALDDQLAAISCPDNCEHEIALIFQPVLQYADVTTLKRGFAQLQAIIEDNILFRHLNIVEGNVTLADWMTNVSNKFDYQTTNGQLFPIITIEAGQKKRFRMINAGGSKNLQLVITDENNRIQTNSCEVWEIALDGMYLNKPRKPKLGRSFLTSSARVEWIVVCHKSGVYKLRSVFKDVDSCSIGNIEHYDNILATINVIGSSVSSGHLNITLPQRPFYVQDFRNYPPSEIYKERFTLESSFFSYLNREKFSESTNFRYKFPVGKVQEWFLTNSDYRNGHPIHLHIDHFQVISYNDYDGPISTYTIDGKFSLVYYNKNGELCSSQVPAFSGGPVNFKEVTFINGSGSCPTWNYVNHREHYRRGSPGAIGYEELGDFRDVIVVPPLSNITIRFLPEKFTGTMVVHCHTLTHADDGMILVAEIVDKGESTNVRKSPVDDLVGKCSASSMQTNLFLILLSFFIIMLQ